MDQFLNSFNIFDKTRQLVISHSFPFVLRTDSNQIIFCKNRVDIAECANLEVPHCFEVELMHLFVFENCFMKHGKEKNKISLEVYYEKNYAVAQFVSEARFALIVFV